MMATTCLKARDQTNLTILHNEPLLALNNIIIIIG